MGGARLVGLAFVDILAYFAIAIVPSVTKTGIRPLVITATGICVAFVAADDTFVDVRAGVAVAGKAVVALAFVATWRVLALGIGRAPRTLVGTLVDILTLVAITNEATFTLTTLERLLKLYHCIDYAA